MKIITKILKTQFGELTLGDYKGKLCLADWRYRKMRHAIDKRIKDGLNAALVDGDTELLENSSLQIKEYENGNRKEFDIPLELVGTDFQKSVWKALLKIPYGETRSYLELSKNLGNEKAIRAVASANGANAISIIIPCHRIIGSDGNMIGYAGGIPAKKKLLEMESKDPFRQTTLF